MPEQILFYILKNVDFQKIHLTDDAVEQLVDQIIESFENNKYTLGVLIDASKAFDTVDHSILLKKLELFGITDRIHNKIKSDLSNRRGKRVKKSLETVSCSVPQSSILGPLLFLLHENYLKTASNILDPIMFTDDTKLIFSDQQSCS